VPAVVEALLNALKDPDSSVKSSAAKALVVVESYGKKAQSVFFDLDPLRGYTGKLR
jgi:HEAT repeat protein